MVIETYRIVKITCAPFNTGPAVKYYDLFANPFHLLEDPNSAKTNRPTIKLKYLETLDLGDEDR